jgi:hypothetical protein
MKEPLSEAFTIIFALGTGSLSIDPQYVTRSSFEFWNFGLRVEIQNPQAHCLLYCSSLGPAARVQRTGLFHESP